MSKRLIRRHEAITRLAVGKTKFHEDIVAREGSGATIPGTQVARLRLVHIGPRASACFEDELDSLIEALRAERDATPVDFRPEASVATARKRHRRQPV